MTTDHPVAEFPPAGPARGSDAPTAGAHPDCTFELGVIEAWVGHAQAGRISWGECGQKIRTFVTRKVRP